MAPTADRTGYLAFQGRVSPGAVWQLMRLTKSV